MNHFEIRRKFKKFFIEKGHHLLPSSSLIPQGNSSLLFVNSGMNQFKDIFLGLKEAPYKKVLSIQKCLRVGGKHNDLEDVGDSLFHHTFFEMLGNFSFGDYFKEEAIDLAWNFLTQSLNIPEDNLYVFVHKKDEESYHIWRDKQKVKPNKIYQGTDKDNFWQMGETGPSGYCTEIHYYKGNKKKPQAEELKEIWNLVFMEFYDRDKNTREKLKTPCVDTGMGLERLTSLLQGTKSTYQTDLFKDIIHALEKETHLSYDFTENKDGEIQKAFRVLADHSKSICFLISEGVLPQSEGSGYVLRRLIRRALYYSQKLNPKKNLLQMGSEQTLFLFSQIYPELKREKKTIEKIISLETEKFFNSLKTGKEKLKQHISSNSFIDEKTAWNLYSTYGFPIDLTRLIAKEKAWSMASQEKIQAYKESLKHKEELQTSTQNLKTELEKQLLFIVPSKTLFTGYEKDKERGKLIVMIKKENSKISISKSLKEGEEAFLIFDKTCFYPEGGGPLGEKGIIKNAKGQAEVLDCFKLCNSLVHQIKVLSGKLDLNETYDLEVYQKYRQGVRSHHTATHLLNSALREVLGRHVKQAGSLVESYFLRFDFTQTQALTKTQIQHIEEKVLKHIEKAENVTAFYKSFSSARKENYLYLQGENYPEKVRVLKIGENISKELCGGLHVTNTKDIQAFKIIKEEGIGTGLRRITAYASLALKSWEKLLINQNLELRAFLNLPTNFHFKQKTKQGRVLWQGKIENQNPFLTVLKQQEKELKNIKQQIIKWEKDQKVIPLLKTEIETKNIENVFHPFAWQILKLTETLKLPLPQLKQSMNLKMNSKLEEKNKSENSKNLLFNFFRKKKEDLLELKNKKREMDKRHSNLSDLQREIKSFSFKNLNIRFLTLLTPLEDRKILSDMSDFLLFKLNLSFVILVGECKEKHPIFINVKKKITPVISAGHILKNYIAPLCHGKGGGKESFAQGSIKNKNPLLKTDLSLGLKKFLLSSNSKTS
ncbi:MAG: alanine--tRNA ligase [Bdellovibrionales bacterium]|nr:alanine--tRNA ligase [Bdellovibrionales bacterium]